MLVFGTQMHTITFLYIGLLIGRLKLQGLFVKEIATNKSLNHYL